MKVKSAKEISDWLLENGYRHNKKGLTCKNEITFAYGMFCFCGLDKPDSFSWRYEWLEPDPADCVYKLCSVWTVEEPDVKQRSYFWVTDYFHDAKAPFIANGCAYINARVINTNELEFII